MSDEERRQLVVYADADLVARCRGRAQYLGVPVSQYVAAVLRAWLDGEEPEGRDDD